MKNVRARATVEDAGQRFGEKLVLADFNDFSQVRSVFQHRDAPNVVALLGTLGNQPSEVRVLNQLRMSMEERDLLLLEVRLNTPETTLDDVFDDTSLDQAFGPLQEYFDLSFQGSQVQASEDYTTSTIPKTRTMKARYAGDVPQLGHRRVNLQYIHLYDAASFLDMIDRIGFDLVHKYDGSPLFLECLLRRKKSGS